MARKNSSNKWKIFWAVVGTLVILAAVFCSVVAIMAHCHNVGFVEEIASWFPKVVEDSKAALTWRA